MLEDVFKNTYTYYICSLPCNPCLGALLYFMLAIEKYSCQMCCPLMLLAAGKFNKKKKYTEIIN